jgi:nitrate reductase gamma subunit
MKWDNKCNARSASSSLPSSSSLFVNSFLFELNCLVVLVVFYYFLFVNSLFNNFLTGY